MRPGEDVQATIRRDGWYGVKSIVSRVITLPVLGRLVHGAGRLVLPKDQLHRLPVSASEVEYVLGSGEKVRLLNPRADQVAKDIYWGGGVPTSPADARILRLVENRSCEVKTFLDIGTYSGLFALIAVKANPKLSAIAFELLPENYLMTVANVVDNDAASRVDVRLCGVGDCPSQVMMPRSTASVSHPSSISLGATYTEGVSVPVVTLDSLSLTGPMLWKIDVEGFEWSVMKGAAEIIRHAKPDIVCEILPEFEHSPEVEALLTPLGYRFFISLDKGFEERPHLVPDAGGRDWFFSRRAPDGTE